MLLPSTDITVYVHGGSGLLSVPGVEEVIYDQTSPSVLTKSAALASFRDRQILAVNTSHELLVDGEPATVNNVDFLYTGGRVLINKLSAPVPPDHRGIALLIGAGLGALTKGIINGE